LFFLDEGFWELLFDERGGLEGGEFGGRDFFKGRRGGGMGEGLVEGFEVGKEADLGDEKEGDEPKGGEDEGGSDGAQDVFQIEKGEVFVEGIEGEPSEVVAEEGVGIRKGDKEVLRDDAGAKIFCFFREGIGKYGEEHAAGD
jgi:hypothetical protein